MTMLMADHTVHTAGSEHFFVNAVNSHISFPIYSMIQVIKSVDQNKLENSWQNFEGIAVTLRQVIDGYLGHIELHLNEIQELIEQ